MANTSENVARIELDNNSNTGIKTLDVDFNESLCFGQRKLSREELLSNSFKDSVEKWNRPEHLGIPRRQLTFNVHSKNHAMMKNHAFSSDRELTTAQHLRPAFSGAALNVKSAPPIVRIFDESGSNNVLCTIDAPVSVSVNASSTNQPSEENSRIKADSSSMFSNSSTSVLNSSNSTTEVGMHRSISGMQLANMQDIDADEYVNISKEERSQFLRLYIYQVIIRKYDFAFLFNV